MKTIDKINDLAQICLSKLKSERERGAKRYVLLASVLTKDCSVNCFNLCHFTTRSKKLHAEVRALRLHPRVEGSTVYVVRVNSLGEWLMAKPCPNCEAFMRKIGVRKSIYTIQKNEYGVLYL